MVPNGVSSDLFSSVAVEEPARGISSLKRVSDIADASAVDLPWIQSLAQEGAATAYHDDRIWPDN